MSKLEQLIQEIETNYPKESLYKMFDNWGSNTADFICDVVNKYSKKKEVFFAFIHSYKESLDILSLARRLNNEVVRKAIDDEKDVVYSDAIISTVRFCDKSHTFRVIENLNDFRGTNVSDFVAKCYNVMSYYERGKYLGKVIDLFEQYKDHKDVYDVACYMVNRTEDRPFSIGVIIDVLMKYPEYNAKIRKHKHAGGAALRELLSERAYRKIVKDPSFIDYILENEIGSYSVYIEDKYVFNNCTYDDLKLLEKTIGIVEEVHRKRDVIDRRKITEGFHEEMHRAINQGKGKQKLRYFRSYLQEVQQRMEENAADLMLIS